MADGASNPDALALAPAERTEPVLVSILIPFFSQGDRDYLRIACESIAAQTHRSLDLLVIVNGPQADETAAALVPILLGCRARILVSQDAGIACALNLGIAEAHGEILVRMDADDISTPERLTMQLDWMIRHRLDVCGAGMRFINMHGRVIRRGYRQAIGNIAIRLALPFYCALPHPTVMFRRSIVRAAGGYQHSRFSEDYELWLRLRRDRQIRFGALPSWLLYYRIHEHQQTDASNRRSIARVDRSLKWREFRRSGNPLFLLGMLPLGWLARRALGRRVES